MSSPISPTSTPPSRQPLVCSLYLWVYFWGCSFLKATFLQRNFIPGGLVAKLCPTLVTPWTVPWQAPLSMGFSWQEHWSGLPFPSQGDLPKPGIEPWSPALQADSLPTELQGSPCLSLGIPQKSLEVVLLKGEAAWTINSYQISVDNARTPEAFRATPCRRLSCAGWILMQLDSPRGHWALLGRPCHLQPFEVRLCLFLSHGWWGLRAHSRPFCTRVQWVLARSPAEIGSEI